MKKHAKKEVYETGFMSEERRFDTNVENSKRRHALPSLSFLNGDARFFERILSVRKAQELVFITKAAARNR